MTLVQRRGAPALRAGGGAATPYPPPLNTPSLSLLEGFCTSPTNSTGTYPLRYNDGRMPRRKAGKRVSRLSPGVSVDDRLQVIREEIEAHEDALGALIDQAARSGATGEAIAGALGVTRVTLYRRYGRSLRAARIGLSSASSGLRE